MGVDPNSGLYSLDVNYQPTGAMGAVTNLLNAQKAQEIAQTLQQQRAAQASLEQQQAEQYGLAAQRQEQARQAVAALGPNTTPEAMAQAWAQSGGDFRDVAPLLRSSVSAQARVSAEGMRARALQTVGLIKAGMTPSDAIAMGSGDMQPDQATAYRDQVLSMMSTEGANKPAAVPAAIAGEKQARGAAETSKAATAAGEAPSIIAKNYAIANAQNAIAGLKKVDSQLAGLGEVTPSQYSQVMRIVSGYDKMIQSLTIDKYGMPIPPTPEAQILIDKYEAAKKAMLDKVALKAKSSGSAIQAPFPYDFFSSTLSGGAKTPPPPAAGSSSPAPVKDSLGIL